jgi:deoxyribonuclease V
VAGVDLAYSRVSGRACCIIAVFTYPGLCLKTVSKACGAVDFPYISGLLTFREGPLVEQAFGRLEIRPEVLMFDGHGISHPRGMGIATHMGIFLDCAALGCAKTPLSGAFEEPGPLRGSMSPVLFKGVTVGCALRTRDRVKPVYVSQGHRVSLATCVEICLSCAVKYRIPEPLRAAHIMAGKAVRSDDSR